MKRLALTPELIADIKAAVGQDVDVTDAFAVFENISLNTLPLPGKTGSIFEKARVSLLTLKQMVDSINGGNHLPLIHGHNMDGVPVGRVFKAGLTMDEAGNAELRTLFYIDPTEAKLAEKVDAGSLDEVSVQFLASQILCSECDFDYRDPEQATWSNFSERTCSNGHTIGTDGVHARLVGLSVFTELSLVTRGAADKPKIVGKSQSKLAPSLLALAASGFEVSELFLTASKGEVEVDLTAVLARNEEIVTENVTLKASVTSVTAERDAAVARADTAEARVAELEAATGDEDAAAALTAATAEADEAKAFLGETFRKLAVAAGETGEITVPETIADLKAGIEAHQSKLTALLPVGGAGVTTQTADAPVGSKFNASAAGAFSAR